MRDDERCGRSKEVNTPKLIGQMNFKTSAPKLKEILFCVSVTANNSTNNNVVFFFVSDLKIVCYNNH